VGDGCAEHGHHGVADELLHGAAEPLDLAPDAAVVPSQRLPHVLGVGLVEARGELDHVAEQDRDDLALLTRALVLG
jgi:hypothetical protein